MNQNKVYEGFLKAALYEGYTLPEANIMYKQAFGGMGGLVRAGGMGGLVRAGGMGGLVRAGGNAVSKVKSLFKGKGGGGAGAPPTGTPQPPSAPPPMPPPINPGPMPPPLPGADGLNGAKGIDPKLLAAIAGLGGAGAGAGGMHMAHTGIEDQLSEAASQMGAMPLPPQPPQQQGSLPPWAAALGGAGLGGAAGIAAASGDKKREGKQAQPPTV